MKRMKKRPWKREKTPAVVSRWFGAADFGPGVGKHGWLEEDQEEEERVEAFRRLFLTNAGYLTVRAPRSVRWGVWIVWV